MSKKIIKAAAAFVLGAVITASGVCTAVAAGNEYFLPEIDDMAITLPADMTAVTSSADANDKYFSVFGLDYNATMENFKSGNIYLQGMDSASSITVTVTMTESDESAAFQNYNLLGANKLSEVARNFLDNSEYTACTVDSADENIVWLYFDTRVTSGGSTIEAYQSNTVYNGKSVGVTLQRNGGSVTAEDYRTFSDIVASVSFGKVNYFGNMLPFFIIGGVVILILLVILIVAIASSAKRRRKKNNNDRILEELAGKYSSKRNPVRGTDEAADDNYPDGDYSEGSQGDTGYDFSTFDADEGRRYSDEDIDAILGETESSEDFQSALPVKQEERKTAEDDTSNNTEKISEFFEDDADVTETEEETVSGGGEISGAEETAQTSGLAGETDTESEADETDKLEEAQAEETAEAEEDSQAAEEAEKPAEANEEEAQADMTGQTEAEDTAGESGNAEENEASEETAQTAENEALDEEEYFNDEVLVREDVRKNRFKKSSDFFEEVPKGVIGVISSKEIEKAEEYDVIGEVEKKVSEVEKETPTAAETVMNGLRKTGSGIRGFFTHCGYFVTNATREIKRSRAKKKKKKAEEERRRRARERAARQRIQRENGGLVQVRRRGQRPQGNRPADRKGKR